MKLSKGMLAAGIVTTVAAGSIVGTSVASAHSGNGSGNVIDKLVERFSLNRDDVQAVFEEVRDEHQADMQAQRDEQLSELVQNGTLTQTQADALKAKQQEMHEYRNELRDQNLSREQLRTQLQEQRESFRAWADEQGIDLQAIKPDRGMGMDGHRHGGPRFAESDDVAE